MPVVLPVMYIDSDQPLERTLNASEQPETFS